MKKIKPRAPEVTAPSRDIFTPPKAIPMPQQTASDTPKSRLDGWKTYIGIIIAAAAAAFPDLAADLIEVGTLAPKVVLYGGLLLAAIGRLYARTRGSLAPDD